MGPQVSEEGDHKDLNNNQGEDQDHDREHNIYNHLHHGKVVIIMVMLWRRMPMMRKEG